MSEIRRHTGDETEQAFLNALQVRTPSTPEWFKGVKKARAAQDLNGIDAIARIERPDGTGVMSVPVQIKRGRARQNRFYKLHPDAEKVGVPIITFPPGTDPEDVRQKTYRAVEPFLVVPRDHFAQFFSKMSGGGEGARTKLDKLRNRKK